MNYFVTPLNENRMNWKTILICVAVFMVFRIISTVVGLGVDGSFFMGWIAGIVAAGIIHEINKRK